MWVRIISLLIASLLLLIPINAIAYAEIVYNPHTGKIEMSPDDYVTLIDTIREYELKLKMYQEELTKERILFEEIKKSFEYTIKTDTEKFREILDRVNSLEQENDRLKNALQYEKGKSSTKNMVIFGLIATCIFLIISD